MKRIILILSFFVLTLFGNCQVWDAVKVGEIDTDSIMKGDETIWRKPVGGEPMITEFTVPSYDLTLTIPLFNTTGYDFTIDWGDGSSLSTITAYNDGDRTHTYTNAGTYTVTFTGTLIGFYFNNGTQDYKITNIIDWGNVGMTSTIRAFRDCLNLLLSDTELPNTITTIGELCFYNNPFTAITIPNSVTSIGSWAFEYCRDLTSIVIPNSVTSLGYACFDGCKSLSSISLSNTLSSIDQYCFQNCDALTSITIPSTVTSIGLAAFISCGSVLSYYVNPTAPPTLGGSALSGATGWKIYVPSGSVDAYKAAAGWSTYASRIFSQ